MGESSASRAGVALERVRRGGLRALAAALRRPLESLTTRVVLATSSASLVASLVVTAISAQSTEAFLRDKIDRKFPEILRTADERLELWFSQRELELRTFAGSGTLADTLGDAQRDPAALDEARTYLAYVLERFPQFQALFALHPGGADLVWTGAREELSPALRARLANAREPQVSPPERLASGRTVQFVSAAVRGPRDERLATLHALIDGEALATALPSEGVGGGGGVYVVDRAGRVLASSLGSSPLEVYERTLPKAGALPVVAPYDSGSGERVVGAGRRFGRFGWTLVVQEPYAEAFAPVVSLVRRTVATDLLIVGIFSLVALQVSRSIARPVVALSRQARRIADGAEDVVLPVSDRRDEIGVLTRAIHAMTTRLNRNQLELQAKQLEIESANARLAAHNSQLQQVNEVLEQLSITDGLTRLHNHRFFQDHLPREVARVGRTGEPLSLLLIDIDDFKSLNDRWGHAAGDSVLRSVAGVMSSIVRDMDLLARYGGEEFALLASRTDLEGALVLAEKIRAEIAETSFPFEDRDGRHQLRISVSIGVASFKGDRAGFFQEADAALYRAKRAGKNCVVAAGSDAPGAG